MNNRLDIFRVKSDFPVDSLYAPFWDKAQKISVDSYWSGSPAPLTRHFSARLLWSEGYLYVRFEATQGEPLILSENPDVTKKVPGLWNRDVCEVFIAPDANDPNKYFEFEVAPTGEWVDIALIAKPDGRESDLEYSSSMETAAEIEKDRVVMAMKIPWKAFGKTPEPGSVWLGNLYRCVGKDPNRGYLAWRPTETKEPSFHVPSKFGEFRFVD